MTAFSGHFFYDNHIPMFLYYAKIYNAYGINADRYIV